MKRMLVLLALFFSFISVCAASDVKEEQLQNIPRFRQKFSHLHPILSELYPVAVSEGEMLWIFDWDGEKQKYGLVKKITPPFPPSPPSLAGPEISSITGYVIVKQARRP